MSEVRLQIIDPQTKLHELDCNGSLPPVLWLHAALNYLTASGHNATYTTHYNTEYPL